jgi:hypothetical protein
MSKTAMSARCQFPTGEPGTPTYRICGAPVTHRPYCETHFRICHASAKAPGRPPVLRKPRRGTGLATSGQQPR